MCDVWVNRVWWTEWVISYEIYTRWQQSDSWNCAKWIVHSRFSSDDCCWLLNTIIRSYLERQTIEHLEKNVTINEFYTLNFNIIFSRGVAIDYRFLLSICSTSMYLAHLEFRLIKCRKQVGFSPYSTRRKHLIPYCVIYFSRFLRVSFILQLHDEGCKRMLRFELLNSKN